METTISSFFYLTVVFQVQKLKGTTNEALKKYLSNVGVMVTHSNLPILVSVHDSLENLPYPPATTSVLSNH